MFNTKLKKRIKFLEELTEVRGRRIDALSDNQRKLMNEVIELKLLFPKHYLQPRKP